MNVFMRNSWRRAAAVIFSLSSVASSVTAHAASQKDQAEYLFYNAKLDRSSGFFSYTPPHINRDYVLVCDAQSGNLYKVTAVMQEFDPTRGKLLDIIRESTLVYLAYADGAAMDVEDQMNTLHLSRPERFNVRKCANAALKL